MIKKRIAICFVLAALLSGCGEGEALPPETEPVTEAVLQTTKPTVQPPEVTTEPIQTQPASEPATEPTTAPLPTLPLPTEPIIAPTEGVTVCGHDYQPGTNQAATCVQAGYQSYVCRKCGDTQQQLTLPLGHSFTDATCTGAKYCSRCGTTEGDPLGHRFENGRCTRCAEQDPSVRTLTIQVKDNKNAPVDGLAVELYIGSDLNQYAGSAVSAAGKISFTLKNHTGSYKLVLTKVPEGYRSQKTDYIYRSDSGAIVLEAVAVIRPDDHSKADYKVGSVMGDFTVTDVDGKSYQLSRLLREKKLVILNFWYCTCVPCKAEFPYFNSIYQRYGQELEILALNHFDSESQIRQLRDEMSLIFPLARENLGMQKGFGIQSYPVSVFLGPEGRILHIQKNVGFQTEQELDALVRQMLGK